MPALLHRKNGQPFRGQVPFLHQVPDPPLSPAIVFTCLFPGTYRNHSSGPFLEAGLHALRSFRIPFLGSSDHFVEPEFGAEPVTVFLVPETGGHQPPGLSGGRSTGHVFTPRFHWRRSPQDACRDLREIVGSGDPRVADGVASRNFVGDVLDGGVVRGGDNHLKAGEFGTQLRHRAIPTVGILPAVFRPSEGLPRMCQPGEAAGPFHHIPGQQVTEHGCLPRSRRSVDTHESAGSRQVVQGLVDGELLAERQAMGRVGEPSPKRQPLYAGAFRHDLRTGHDVHAVRLPDVRGPGQIRLQCAPGNGAVDDCSPHPAQVFKEKAVEEFQFLLVPVADLNALDEDSVGGQVRQFADVTDPVSRFQKIFEGPGILGRGFLCPCFLTTPALHGVELFAEAFLGSREFLHPVQRNVDLLPGFGLIGDPANRPQGRGEHRGPGNQPPVLIHHHTDAGAAPRWPWIVGIVVVVESLVQPFVCFLEPVQSEIDLVPPDEILLGRGR